MDALAVRRIQAGYIEMLENHYAAERERLDIADLAQHEHRTCRDKGVTSQLIYPHHGSIRTSEEHKAEEFLDDVRKFWGTHADDLDKALDDGKCIRAIMWGDLDLNQFVRKFCFYFDTVLVPDAAPWFVPSSVPAVEYSEQFIFWSKLVLDLKELILAETDAPIVAIFPQRFNPHGGLEPQPYQSRGLELGDQASRIAHRCIADSLNIEPREDRLEALLESIHKLGVRQLNERPGLDELSSLLESFSQDVLNQFPEHRPFAGLASLFDRLHRRLLLATDIPQLVSIVRVQFQMLESREENAHIYDADNVLSSAVWSTFRRKNHFLAKHYSAELVLSQNALLTHSFQHHFHWIDGFSNSDLVWLHSEDRLSELRETFSSARQSLKRATIDGFPDASCEYERAVVRHLDEYQNTLEDCATRLRRRRRGKLISFGAAASIAAATMAFPALLPLTIAAAVYGLGVGGASAKDLVDEHLAGKRTLVEVRSRPIALLLDKKFQGQAD